MKLHVLCGMKWHVPRENWIAVKSQSRDVSKGRDEPKNSLQCRVSTYPGM